MMTSTNQKYHQRFANFWSNVTKLSLAATVNKDTAEYISVALSKTQSIVTNN